MKRLLIALMVLGLVGCGADDAEPAEVDCAGVAGGDAIEDACGVCDGDGSSCADCAGVPNGDAVEDACGVCAGDGSSCVDCAGIPNGDSVEDVCGICDGDGTSCLDCAGVVNGASVEDPCGVCDGDGSSCADCAGVPNGNAVFDSCGVCDGNGPPDGDESLCGFVLIEAGIFTMGSPESELGRGSDEAQHQVMLTSGFYLSDHEVTQAEWQALMGNNPSQKNNGSCPTCPVETVNWWEALHYANALSESEGLRACYVLEGCNGNAVGADKECADVMLQDGNSNTVWKPYECEGYRLPTEAEWEYAARAGTTTAFYNGDITVLEDPDPNANDIAWYSHNSGSTTHAVKGKLPNAWGLYDMSGNVGEWTWDWYGRYYDDVIDINPTGNSWTRAPVVRGGSWDGYVRNVRVADRSHGTIGNRYDEIGFRLARTAQ